MGQKSRRSHEYWSLKDKKFYHTIFLHGVHDKDMVEAYDWCENNLYYKLEDIEVLREKLIEDFKFSIEKEYHYLIPIIEKIINKRFGVEK